MFQTSLTSHGCQNVLTVTFIPVRVLYITVILTRAGILSNASHLFFQLPLSLLYNSLASAWVQMENKSCSMYGFQVLGGG